MNGLLSLILICSVAYTGAVVLDSFGDWLTRRRPDPFRELRDHARAMDALASRDRPKND